MDNMEGELNRRLAVLAVLYFQRRVNPYSPGGFAYGPGKAHGLSARLFGIHGVVSPKQVTAEGVDFVETQRMHIPVVGKLLSESNGYSTETKAATSTTAVPTTQALLSWELNLPGR